VATTDFDIFDDRFGALVPADAKVRKLTSGAAWAEGPVYVPGNDRVIWSDVRNNRMMQWSERAGMTIFRQPSHHSNGNTLDLQGRLVTCEHSLHRISRTEPDGTVVTLVDRYRGNRLNSPNDVVVRSDGTIWFTDPPYGILTSDEGYQRESELEANYVFRFDPAAGKLDIVADDFYMPNGLAFSPDEKTLYVSESGCSHYAQAPRHIRAFDVVDGRRLANGREFVNVAPGCVDGFRVDSHGYVFASFNSGHGVRVFTPEGECIGAIRVPERASNCTFGGPDGTHLFITATTSLYVVSLNTTDARAV